MSDKSSTPQGYEKCLINHCDNMTRDILCFDCWCNHDKAVEIFNEKESAKNE